jgi:N-acetylmuramoyl-L-alanine amidase
MRIVNHRLEGVKFLPSPNVSGMMDPSGAIMHYTAGYTASSAIQTLVSPAAKVSAHLVIDRDGTITQLVPFNRVAWHAGPSAFNGRSGCNGFTIGFEFVNPGYFRIAVDGTIMDWEGKRVVPKAILDQYDLTVRAPDKRIGGGVFIWPGYTKAQIDAGLAALAAIHAQYGLDFVTGHEDIDTRKWKTDPGDAFPMGRFKEALHGKAEAVMGRADGMTQATTRFLVNTPKLNVRNAPNSAAPVITTLSGGSEAIVIRDLGAWAEVEYAPGHRGYLSDQYLKKVV